MGSQTAGRRPLDYFTVGIGLFDDPRIAKCSPALMGFWLFISCEACKTHGRVSVGMLRKAAGFVGSVELAVGMSEELLSFGVLEHGSDDEWLLLAGWDKYQITPGEYPHPSDRPENTAERKRRSRASTRDSSRDCHEYSTRDSHDPSRDSVTTEKKRRDDSLRESRLAPPRVEAGARDDQPHGKVQEIDGRFVYVAPPQDESLTKTETVV